MGVSFKHKTVNGVTGFALESFLRFLTGEKPIKTTWENKSFIFYIKGSYFEHEKLNAILKRFENEYLVQIKDISTYE